MVGWQVESRETFSLLEREGRDENFERIEVEKKMKNCSNNRDWHRITLKKLSQVSSVSSFSPFNFPSLLGTISI